MSREVVPLSTGREASVGELSWGAYKKLKAQILKMLAEDLPEVFELVTQKNWSGIGGLIAEKLVDLEEPFITGCLAEPVPGGFDSLGMSDMRKLSAAVSLRNPLSEILAYEKNSFSGGLLIEMAQILAKQGADAANLKALADGGFGSSTESPSDTAG